MVESKTAEFWIHKLSLTPHPEGGFYREMYRSNCAIYVPISHNGEFLQRSASTAIYFLLKRKECSHFHRLSSDEMWFFHAGCPLEIVLITPEGLLERRFLGHPAYHAECSFQVLLPAGTIFAARIYDDSSYFDSDFALVSCTVAPGFEFADFELLSRAALLADFPEFSEEIRQFTKA